MQYIQNKIAHSFVKDSLIFVVTDFTGEGGGISGLRGLEEQSLSIFDGGLIPDGFGSDNFVSDNFVSGCSAINGSTSDNFDSDDSDFDDSASGSAFDGCASDDSNSDILSECNHCTTL